MGLLIVYAIIDRVSYHFNQILDCLDIVDDCISFWIPRYGCDHAYNKNIRCRKSCGQCAQGKSAYYYT